MQITEAQFIAWSKEHASLALTVCKAQAYAEVMRKKVDAYIRPIFDRFTFLPGLSFRSHVGDAPITDPEHLHLCEDEAMLKAYYDACHEEHLKQGYTGEWGFCPALRAENLLTQAENVFLEAGAELMGLENPPFDLDLREKMLKLLLGACLKDVNPKEETL